MRRLITYMALLGPASGCSLIFTAGEPATGDDSGVDDGGSIEIDATVQPCSDDQDCGIGQECSIEGFCVCTPNSCKDGCCDGPVCRIPQFGACGLGGGECVVCDSLIADECSGTCVCGSTGDACAEGQRCAEEGGGRCVCDADSCPGGCCTDENQCIVAGTDDNQCGILGGQCFDCLGETCGADGVCSGCDCSGTGCCNGPACVADDMQDLMACGGTTGGACVVCGSGADSCGPDGCECSGNGACEPGLECTESGGCECTEASCNGCCFENKCQQPGASEAICDTGDEQCFRCLPEEPSCNGAGGGNGSCQCTVAPNDSCGATECCDPATLQCVPAGTLNCGAVEV